MAGKSFRFTKSALDQLPVPTNAEAGFSGYVMYWDTVVIGFGVVVRPSGLMTFVLVYRNKEGRVRRLTIGRYGRVTLEQAREAAKRQNGKIVLGGDPVAEKKQYQNAKTVDELFEDYLRRNIIPNGSAHAVRSVNRVRALVKKELGHKFTHEVTTADIRNCLDIYRKQRGNFNLILTYVRAAWNWARDRGFGLIYQNSHNPAHGIEPLPSTSHAREIAATEYKAVFDTIERLFLERRNDPARLLACLFIIETGCRPVEAVRLRRDHVFRLRGFAELSEHKTFKRTGTPKKFFLTPAVLQILARAEALHILRNMDSEFVFPRRNLSKASNWLAKTWASVRKHAGVDLELRHFRSGFINVADDAGLTEGEIAEITQHGSIKTIRRHYRVIKDKKAALNAALIGARLQQFKAIKTP